MTIYNPWDNVKLAEDLLLKLRLEESDLRGQIEYEQDTGHYEVDDMDYRHLENLNRLIVAIVQYIHDNQP